MGFQATWRKYIYLHNLACKECDVDIYISLDPCNPYVSTSYISTRISMYMSLLMWTSMSHLTLTWLSRNVMYIYISAYVQSLYIYIYLHTCNPCTYIYIYIRAMMYIYISTYVQSWYNYTSTSHICIWFMQSFHIYISTSYTSTHISVYTSYTSKDISIYASHLIHAILTYLHLTYLRIYLYT